MSVSVQRCAIAKPSHGGNTGSNPVGDATNFKNLDSYSESDVQNLDSIRDGTSMDAG
jgi:hypothetical protein